MFCGVDKRLYILITIDIYVTMAYKAFSKFKITIATVICKYESQTLCVYVHVNFAFTAY